MAASPSSRPVRGVPLGLIVAAIVGLQVIVMATAAALELRIFRLPG